MRLIDADALKAKYEQMLPEIGDGYHKETLQDVLFELEYAPTVSPDEVRGVGKWIERDDYDWDIYYECSVCHTPFTMLDGTTPELNDYHYCPNCGAKMEVSEDA